MRTGDVLPIGLPPIVLVCCFDAFSVWVVPLLLETGQCHPKSEWSICLLCCQLQIYFQNSSVSVRLGRFMERSDVLPSTQLAGLIGKVWASVIHFCVWKYNWTLEI